MPAGVFYFSLLEQMVKSDKKITEEDLEKIKKLMQDKVKLALPFEQLETSRIEAIEYFKKLKINQFRKN